MDKMGLCGKLLINTVKHKTVLVLEYTNNLAIIGNTM